MREGVFNYICYIMNTKVIEFLFLFIFGALFSCKTESEKAADPYKDDGTSVYFESELKPFYHGVASGDPLSNRVIIWTRVTPETGSTVEVNWDMATDPEFSQIVQQGKVVTDKRRDYTVKVDVVGLDPGQFYFYRFSALGGQSITGRTKTAPQGSSVEIKLAVVSCSNFEAGYFNAYDRIADRNDLDAVIHLGDYIYEYEPKHYGDSTLERFHLPPREIVQLQDYRTRYSQYRLDPSLRRVHQQHPFITIWDDHEIANDTYISGAKNHQPEEGAFNQRIAAAVQAYFEWLPVRDNPHKRIFRSFNFGDLVDLMMLDGRLEGRSEQVDLNHPDYMNEKRTLIGSSQLDWLTNKLVKSAKIWKIIGNPVLFTPYDRKKAYPNWIPRKMDSWDGYPMERKKLVESLVFNQVGNVLIVSGDTHSSWGFESVLDPLSPNSYNPETGEGAFAVELGTTSISSANLDESVSSDSALAVEKILMEPKVNPHLKYTNQRDHGYLLLTLSMDEAKAEWYYVDRVDQISSDEILGKSLIVKNGSYKLWEVE